MNVVVNILILIVGFVALIKGADLFVDSSSTLAKIFRVPGLIIGLTIVAYGTSTPELAVSTLAAIEGSSEIAISNVVGSNIFNLLGVLGVCALIYPLPVEKGIVKRDFPVSIGITVLVLVGACYKVLFFGQWLNVNMGETAGVVSRMLSIVILVLFVCYTVYLIIDAKKHPADEDNADLQPLWKSMLLIFVGIVFVVVGGRAVVYSARAISQIWGMTETLIGLTVVAVGTSLPELVTSIVAAKKGEAGMAVGNVVGSNIFNMMFILGLASVIQPVSVNIATFWDLIILAIISIIAFVISLSKRTISRLEGAVMLLIYTAYMVFAILR